MLIDASTVLNMVVLSIPVLALVHPGLGVDQNPLELLLELLLEVMPSRLADRASEKRNSGRIGFVSGRCFAISGRCFAIFGGRRSR
jgi:hypothetical protein